MPPSPGRELRGVRRYRLLARPPLTVEFPSVIYIVDVEPVPGAPQWRLEARALGGRPNWTLCQQGQERAWLERELFETGFDVVHPTAPSAIVERLCATGRALRCAGPCARNRPTAAR